MIDIYKEVSRIITYGIVIAMILFAIGIVLLVAQGGAPGVRLNGSMPLSLNTASYSLATSLMHPSGITLIYAALFVLVSIPITVVIALNVVFFRERNRIYMVLGIVVLADLLVAILLLPAILR